MQWVLHDPEHGAYGAGRLRIGPAGDFVTAPSMGGAMAEFLAAQVASWLEQLDRAEPQAHPAGPGEVAAEERLSLVETGPGEGDLADQLVRALLLRQPDRWQERLELVLIEPNPGMERRQRQRLEGCPVPVRWCRFDDLASSPVQGVVLAHEVLDALAVERVVSGGERWCRQEVLLTGQPAPRLELTRGAELTSDDPALALLTRLGLAVPGPGRPHGWCSEVHVELTPWLGACGRALRRGQLLVIDYTKDAARYYAPLAREGTLLAYRQQRAHGDPLQDPGHCDLTAHLCSDSLSLAAADAGFQDLGSTSQGEALLALGLSQALHALQQPSGPDLTERLRRREELLRLVDPHALGGFRWHAFARSPQQRQPEIPGEAADPPLFLREPAGP
ncbi:SAM-dependent methyltransferase [Synechococcus sp. RSCCF101]|nr:SAM-dependent methyltransferase [Synechococcus sp. RSCCF101]